jgi:hypothetical protein
VLGGVRQCFCDDVIGGHLNRLRESSLDIDTQLNRHRGAATKGSQRRAQPPSGQHRRMNALRHLPQLLARFSETITDSGKLMVQVAIERQRGLKRSNTQSQGDEALLCSVVQIALDAPPGLVAGGDDPRA